ncbi:hypothetical protein ACU8KH_06651 [Lachancea thermotolerans]
MSWLASKLILNHNDNNFKVCKEIYQKTCERWVGWLFTTFVTKFEDFQHQLTSWSD